MERHKEWREKRWVTKLDKDRLLLPSLATLTGTGMLLGGFLLQNQHIDLTKSPTYTVGGVIAGGVTTLGSHLMQKIAEKRAAYLSHDEGSYRYEPQRVEAARRRLEYNQDLLKEGDDAVAKREAALADLKSSVDMSDKHDQHRVKTAENTLKLYLGSRRTYEKWVRQAEQGLHKTERYASAHTARLESRIAKETPNAQ